MRAPKLITVVCAIAGGFAGSGAAAKVVSFDIDGRAAPAFGGASYGDVGPYERLDAVAHFAIDPKSERGAAIVDLDKAPVGEDGLVHFTTEVVVLRPADPAKGSGVLFYDVLNRGRALGPLLLEMAPGVDFPETAEENGDGFLLEQGYTIVWSGWQIGLQDGKLNLNPPVLDGVAGLTREEFVFDEPGTKATVRLSYPPVDLDPAKATLSVRTRADDARSTAPGLGFRYLSEREIEIDRPEGLDAGAIYEFVYPAKEARPAGLGFAATSDLVSFLRGAPGHDAETPLEGIEATVALGISQSGRFLRDFIYSGFNADESGARVFDGAIPLIAGSRKTFTNYRFAQQGRYSRQHEDHDFPGDQFPFAYVPVKDPVSGREDSVLAACAASGTCPKIMHIDTSTEFWQGRAALVSTAPDGTALETPEDVRLYFIAGTPHFATFGAQSETNEVCRFPTNPVSTMPAMRALVVAMAAWAKAGTPPPPSRFPSVADGGLVPLAAMKLPDMPEDDFIPVYNELRLRDEDGALRDGGPAYPAWVPQLDEDGIPLGGVRPAAIAAPLGTFWGWNLRNPGFAGGDLCGLTGSFIPFAKEAQEGDGRRPIAARYADEAAYVAAVEAAAEALVEEGFMLAEDIPLVAARAAEDYRAFAE